MIFKKMWHWLIRGFIISVPAGIIIYIASSVFKFADNLGKNILEFILPNSIEKFIYTGMGLILLIIIAILIGKISEEKRFGKLVDKIPILNFFLGNNTKTITPDELTKWTPCQFWATPTQKKEGWIAGMQTVKGKKDQDVKIYFASPPVLLTGEPMNIPWYFVIKLANPSGEIVNKLMTYGKVSPDELMPARWEDFETEEEFQERINSTPFQIEMKKLFRDGKL